MNNNYKECSDFSNLASSLKGIRGKKYVSDKTVTAVVVEEQQDTPVDTFRADPMPPAVDVSELQPIVPVMPKSQHPLLSSHIRLSGNHRKVITCLAFDPLRRSGLLVAGSADGTLTIYDFAGMRGELLAPTRTLRISDTAGISCCAFRPNCSASPQSSQYLLLSTSASGPCLLDMGTTKIVREWAKGDRYVMDQRRTAGHTGVIRDVVWSPDGEKFVSCGADGTVRIWDAKGIENMNEFKRQCISVPVLLERKKDVETEYSRRPAIGSVKWVSEKSVIAGVDDGSIVGHAVVHPSLRPSFVFDIAEEILDLLPRSEDQVYVRTRSRVKLVDLRSLCTLAESEELLNCFDTINLSCTGDAIVTGTAHHKKHSRHGSLVFLDPDNLSFTSVFEIPEGVSCVHFNPELHQLAVGTASGDIAIFYDPEKSVKAAVLLSKVQGSKKKPSNDVFIAPSTTAATIISPNALPLFAVPEEEAELLADPLNLKRLRDRLDAKRSARPDLPVLGEGHDGRIGSGPNAGYMRQIIQRERKGGFDRMEDPRDALLRYAEKAEQEPRFVAPAYRETQLDPVFDYEALEREVEKKAKKAKEAKPDDKGK